MLSQNLLTPLIVAAVAIVGLTAVEAVVSDRFDHGEHSAADFAKRFADVPKSFGNWEGVDKPVTDDIQERSGAIGYVSRTYTNQVTNAKVDLWLIIGHARDVIRHTPDICYPSQGSRQAEKKFKHTIQPEDGQPGRFFTAQFENSDDHARGFVRVFWAWNANKPGETTWDAPGAPRWMQALGFKGPRWYYGNNPTLYKMYFIAPVFDDTANIDDSAGAMFGREILPYIDRALFPEESGAAADESTGEDS